MSSCGSAAGWSRLEEWNQNIESRAPLTKPSPEANSQSCGPLHSLPSGSLCSEQRISELEGAPPSGRGVFAINGRYAFWVRQKGPGQPWSLRLTQSGDAGCKQINKELESRYYFATTPHFSCRSRQTTRRHVDRPKFCLACCGTGQLQRKADGQSYFRRTRNLGLNRPVPYEGYRVFNPFEFWVCVEWFSTCTAPERGIPRRHAGQADVWR